jgi:CcmD family protein
MESNEKMMVVVTILAVIMLGIYVYLFSLDRKIRKIEKQLKEKNQPE